MKKKFYDVENKNRQIEHLEYTQMIENSQTVVMFIHGILGTPNHFRDYLPLVPKEWSIVNILLTGHGGTVDEFSVSSFVKWKNQVRIEFEILSTKYNNIVIVAHSMGALFAIDLAIENPKKVTALFLLATPLKPILNPSIIFIAYKLLFCNISENDNIALATKYAYSIAIDRRLWKYIKWSPHYVKLYKEIKMIRKKIHLLTTPCHSFLSSKDELVSITTETHFKTIPNVSNFFLPNSRHFYYHKDDYTFLLNQFEQFCQNIANTNEKSKVMC